MHIDDSIAARLKHAIADHQVGQLQEAERLYVAILQAEPGHAEANHNLGVLMVQMKQPAAALPHFLAALEADGANGQYWISYIDALHQAGQIDDARQILALAWQQGLQGDEVDELQRRLNGGTTDAGGGARPTNQQIDEVVALFSAGRLDEAAGIAQQLTDRYPQHEFGWKALGAIYKQQGKSEAALAPMQKAAALSPNDVEAHYNLGVTLQEMDRFDEAEAAYRHALQIDPNYADAHSNLGVVLQTRGKLEEARDRYQRAAALRPGYVAAHINLGNVLTELGRLADAEGCYRRVVQLMPIHAEAHCNLGVTLMGLGRYAEAQTSFNTALQLKPDYAAAHFNLGNSLKAQGRLDDSQASYRNALRINPDMAEAHYNLGNLLLDIGRLPEAEDCYRQALRINPELADAHYNLGNTLKEQGKLAEAEAAFRRALAIWPEYAQVWCNLGNIYLSEGRMQEAESVFRRAVQLKPELAEAHCNLGNALLGLDRLDEAQASYRRALQIRPDFPLAHSNLIFTLDLSSDSEAAMFQERRQWAAMHADHLLQPLAHSNIKDPVRRLRIGYVSADFRKHSAAYTFGAMLTHFDRDSFEVIAYSNSTVGDELTRIFQNSVTAWRDIARMSDDAAADLIRNDNIDILVDLSGHSSGNRLLVFARKPAPIQITAFGYASGTGMRAMDVLFSDPVFIPPDARRFYSEQVRYLPSGLGFVCPDQMPAVSALPALTGNGITFGSFNRLVKNSEAAYDAWVQILQAVPDSRMILKTPALNDSGTRARVMGYFANAGIDPERIILLGKTSREEHIAAYSRIDIALDPFPHGGGVSALEGLMMGVPVLTLRWPTLAGRVSSSIMTTLGLTDWIAETPQQYVALATEKASDLQSLTGLRQSLRSMVLSSVLGDQAAYVRAVEHEYRKLWQEWCSVGAGQIDEH